MDTFKSNHIKQIKIDSNTKIDILNALTIASNSYATFQILKMQLIKMMVTIVLFIKKYFLFPIIRKKMKYKLLKSKVISQRR